MGGKVSETSNGVPRRAPLIAFLTLGLATPVIFFRLGKRHSNGTLAQAGFVYLACIVATVSSVGIFWMLMAVPWVVGTVHLYRLREGLIAVPEAPTADTPDAAARALAADPEDRAPTPPTAAAAPESPTPVGPADASESPAPASSTAPNSTTATEAQSPTVPAARRAAEAGRSDTADAKRRRRIARRTVVENPSHAKDMRIGRPDLDRKIHDGGLVDVNSAPAEVIATLPGLTPDVSRAIVAHRSEHGPFDDADDLIRSVPIVPEPTPQLRVYAVFVP
ncbi:ComEA family DNA-binding protein [Salininema proteolyticum]|uniref:ComEA family DNA-binding protein n=1 Tax=Salininema proteolyticum TaxID=1607685 RepID=A0ABV8U318_9ACTN